MAISTIKISDTQEWVKRMTYGRPTSISNALEPALSSANMVMQTILGPPFTWWWNNKELAITCNPTLVTGSITNVALTTNVLTLNVSNASDFPVGSLVVISNLVTATFLNGQGIIVTDNSSNQITADFVHADYVSAADTGDIDATSTQDYSVNVPNFSHIEHASVLDISVTPSKWYELSVENNLSYDTISARPRFINPHTEDSSGNMTFRLMPAPNRAYPINIHVQTTAPLVTSVNQTWAPIPDYMQYVYNWGFLSLMYLFSDDSRFGYANQKFTAALIARAEGITQEERNIFLNNWDALTTSQQLQTQQGISARGI